MYMEYIIHLRIYREDKIWNNIINIISDLQDDILLPVNRVNIVIVW